MGIRTQLSAVRTRENLERALAAFVKVGKKHDVLWKTKAKRLARCGL